MRCEDFPCCGHEAGDCPDPDPEPGFFPFRCVECGGRIKHGEEMPNAPSMHESCARFYLQQSMIEELGYDPYEED